MNTVIAKAKEGVDLRKYGIWIIIGLFNVITIAIAIVEAKWFYLGAFLVPFLIYFSIKNPFIFPFGLYAFLLPFDQILTVIGFAKGSTLTKFIGILTILTLALKGFFENKLIKPNTVTIIFMFFIIYCVLSLLWAIDPAYVVSRIPTAIGLFILYLLVSSYKIQEREYDTLKWCILFGGILAAILTFYNYKTFQGTQRATIILSEKAINPNALAISLLMPLSICVEMILKQKRKFKKGLFFVLFAFMLFCIIITGSRKSLLGVGAILIIYNTFIKKKLTFSIIVSVIILVLLSIVPDFFIERTSSILEDQGSGRLGIWSAGLKAFEQYWLFGAGLDNFPVTCDKFINYGTSFEGYSRPAHNTPLMILVETGIVGCALMVWALRKHYQLLKSHLIYYDINLVMLKASFWSILIVGFFADILWDKTFWMLFMMILMYKNTQMNNIHHFILEKEPR